MRFSKFSVLITLQAVILASLLGIVAAQPSKPHPTVKSKPSNVSGVDTITAKEAEDKTTKNDRGWNGSYVGVNAGTSFGATAGTNVVVPLGSNEQSTQ